MIGRTINIVFKLHFMLLAYSTEQIWLQNGKYMSHYPHSMCATDPTLLYICAKTQPTATSASHHCDMCQKQMCLSNCTHMPYNEQANIGYVYAYMCYI